MKTLTFAKRTAKEIYRDPVNLFFGLGFPIIILLLLSAIQANIPVSLFEIEQLAPGIAVFGLSFMTLFCGSLVAKDQETAFLQRLYTTPMTAVNFIAGYGSPLLIMALAQGVFCYLTAVFLGLPVTANLLLAVPALLPVALLFVSLGLLFGSILNSKQVGGICGALLTNLTAWLSGIWFDLELVGGSFQRVANLLPFVHAVKWEQAVLSGQIVDGVGDLFWVLGYGIAVTLTAVFLFLRQMKQA